MKENFLTPLGLSESIRQSEQEIMYRTFDDSLWKLMNKYCDLNSLESTDMYDYYKLKDEAFNLIMKTRGEDILL